MTKKEKIKIRPARGIVIPMRNKHLKKKYFVFYRLNRDERCAKLYIRNTFSNVFITLTD